MTEQEKYKKMRKRAKLAMDRYLLKKGGDNAFWWFQKWLEASRKYWRCRNE